MQGPNKTEAGQSSRER